MKLISLVVFLLFKSSTISGETEFQQLEKLVHSMKNEIYELKTTIQVSFRLILIHKLYDILIQL